MIDRLPTLPLRTVARRDTRLVVSLSGSSLDFRTVSLDGVPEGRVAVA